MLENWLKKNQNELIQLRRYLHENPEIGYAEKETSAYLKNYLKSLELQIIENNDMKFGFYTELGPLTDNILAIRCDLDALPIQDIKNCDYSSKKTKMMHACGHDAHMTILIGLIKLLKEHESKLTGRLRFIFQPAEECSPGGAISMIKGGAINNVTHIIGYHLYPMLNANQIAIKEGFITATVEVIEIELKCNGGHTSRPEESVDLVLATSMLVSEINKNLEQIKSDESPIVFVFGSINGGDTFNVIPSNIKLKGTLRYVNSAQKETIHGSINKAISEINNITGTEIEFSIPYSSPGIYNNKLLTQLIIDSGNSILEKNNTVILEKGSLGGEDFAFYLEKIPGAYFRIGCYDGHARDLHCNYFDINEDCIFTGINILKSVILNYGHLS
ncbi:MAG: amidohydrolase [Candidatus Marinimicrobia bacterium]|nr:amidohydrolase [Candidatus Neomarinimicrobiota bacterium]